MAKIKKYQMGGTPVKKYPGTNPKKIDTTKKAPYYDLRDDYKEPGAKKRESEMIKELKKKPTMPASKKNVGRKGIKVKKAKGGASLKPVPADRQKSLGKLPTAVRNKMGYQKNGGKMKKARGGATLSPTTSSVSKRLGSSKKLRGGGTLAPSKSSTSRRLSSAHTRKAMGGMKMGKCKYGC